MNNVRIKILLVARSFDHLGGIVNYCQMLQRNIDHVVIYDHFITGKDPKEHSSFIKLIKHFLDIYRLIRRLFENRYDIIHINPSMMYVPLLRDCSLLVLLLLFGYRNSIMIFIHGWDDKAVQEISQYSLLRRILVRLFQASGQIVVLSPNFKKKLTDMGFSEEGVHVVTTMYEKTRIPFLNLGEHDKINILFMARFVVEKGLFIAGKVAKCLKEEGHNEIHFIFAGDGPERPNFEKFIHENGLEDFCEITGYVRGQKKSRVLARSHIFLFPTFYPEGCPIVVLEAMGAGAAIVSTRVAAIPEVVIEGVNGFLHEKAEESFFTSSIRNLLSNRHLLNSMRYNSFCRADKNYEAIIVSKNIKNIYENILFNKNK